MWVQQSEAVTSCTQELSSHHVHAQLFRILVQYRFCVCETCKVQQAKHQHPSRRLLESFNANFHCSFRPPVAQGRDWHPWLKGLHQLNCSHWHICAAKILRAPTLLQSRRGLSFLHRPTECCLSAGTKTYVTLLPASHSVFRWNFKSHIEESANINYCNLYDTSINMSMYQVHEIQNIVVFILHTNTSCSKGYSRPMLVGLKFHLPRDKGPESRGCH